MTINLTDPMIVLCGFFFDKLTHQLIKLTLLKMIEFHFLHWEVQVDFFLMHSNYCVSGGLKMTALH